MAMGPGILLIILTLGFPLFLLVACLIILLKMKKRGFWAYLHLGWGAQVALSLPAGVFQAFCIPGINGSPFWVRLLLPLVAWLFNMGGYTVRLVFESTVEPLEWLVGHRSTTVMSNLPYFGLLMFIQATLIAAAYAVWMRRREGKTGIDPVVIIAAVLFLINSVANASWPWWGT